MGGVRDQGGSGQNLGHLGGHSGLGWATQNTTQNRAEKRTASATAPRRSSTSYSRTSTSESVGANDTLRALEEPPPSGEPAAEAAPIEAVRAMPGEAGVDSTVVSEDDVDRAAAGGGVRDGTITLGSTDDEAAAAGAEDAAEAAEAVLLRLFVGVRSTCWDGRRGFMWSGFRSDAFRGACALKAKSSELSSASIVGASAGLARFAVAASASASPAFRFAAPAPSAGAALSRPFHFLRSSPAAPCTFSSSALRSLLIVLPIPDACIAFTVIGRCASSARSSSVVDAVAGVTARVHHSFTSLSAVLFVKLSSSAGSVVARSDATTSCCDDESLAPGASSSCISFVIAAASTTESSGAVSAANSSMKSPWARAGRGRGSVLFAPWGVRRRARAAPRAWGSGWR